MLFPLLTFAAAPGRLQTWPILWPILVTLVVGALAVYLLLPRPRAYSALAGGVLGLAALLLWGFLLVRAGAASPEVILFYAFATVAIVSGALLVTQRNPARAALSFTLVVLSTCGLFLLLAAPFLMAATVIIYAGAIVVTFLFVLMLAQQIGLSDADARSREPLLSTVTGFVLLGALLFTLHASYGTDQYNPALADINRLLERTRLAEAGRNADEVRRIVGRDEPTGQTDLIAEYKGLLDADGMTDLKHKIDVDVQGLQGKQGLDFETANVEEMKAALAKLEAIGEQARQRLVGRLSWLRPEVGAEAVSPVSGLSGPPATVLPQELRRGVDNLPQLPAENPGYLGKSLFTDYLLPVELGGTLLLVATVGAIAIAHRRPNPERPT